MFRRHSVYNYRYMALTEKSQSGIKDLMDLAYQRLNKAFISVNGLEEENLAIALKDVAGYIERARGWIRERE